MDRQYIIKVTTPSRSAQTALGASSEGCRLRMLLEACRRSKHDLGLELFGG